MPEPALAQSVIATWSQSLESLTQGLKERVPEKLSEGKKRTIRNLTKGKEGVEGRVNRWPKSGTYGWQALRWWRSTLDLGDGEAAVKKRTKVMEEPVSG